MYLNSIYNNSVISEKNFIEKYCVSEYFFLISSGVSKIKE